MGYNSKKLQAFPGTIYTQWYYDVNRRKALLNLAYEVIEIYSVLLKIAFSNWHMWTVWRHIDRPEVGYNLGH